MIMRVLEGSDRARLSDKDRFDLYVKDRPEVGCWNWGGYIHITGYGQFTRLGVTMKAHRWCYRLLVGDIPDGLLVRHKCDNRSCVRPDHLEVGTHADNRRDCAERGRAKNQNSYKTHCSIGHEFSEKNTYTTSEGWRTCRECHRITELNRRKAAR